MVYIDECMTQKKNLHIIITWNITSQKMKVVIIIVVVFVALIVIGLSIALPLVLRNDGSDPSTKGSVRGEDFNTSDGSKWTATDGKVKVSLQSLTTRIEKVDDVLSVSNSDGLEMLIVNLEPNARYELFLADGFAEINSSDEEPNFDLLEVVKVRLDSDTDGSLVFDTDPFIHAKIHSITWKLIGKATGNGIDVFLDGSWINEE
jgi:hypothetical protein